MVERLVSALRQDPLTVGYVKRTHHLLDLPHKASGRVWASRPSAMLIHADDRTQLTVHPTAYRVEALVNLLPPGLDVVLLETHTPEAYPTIRSEAAEPAPGEHVIGEWNLESLDAAAAIAVTAIRAELPANPGIRSAISRAVALHGGQGCAGLVLGARLALAGAANLGIELPDRQKRLRVIVETDRCSFDAIQAVTGCSIGRGTIAVENHGKLAATFYDGTERVAIRVAVRPGLRAHVTPVGVPEATRRAVQREAYLTMPECELFTVSGVPCVERTGRDPRDRVGQHLDCNRCGEEVLAMAVGVEGLCAPCGTHAASVASESPKG